MATKSRIRIFHTKGTDENATACLEKQYNDWACSMETKDENIKMFPPVLSTPANGGGTSMYLTAYYEISELMLELSKY